MRRSSSRPGGQTPRSRRTGRLSPTNGSVTRADLQRIHDEFIRSTRGIYTPDQLEAITEHLVYLKGAIEDPSHPPSRRRLMARRQRERRARERQERQARSELAQLPARAAAAA